MSATDVSGNPVPPTDPRPHPSPLAPLKEGIKTINDIFKRMEENTTFESFVEAGCAATGVDTMEPPQPATRQDFLVEGNNMSLKAQFASLRKFKDVPMTYSEMRERYG